MQELEVFRVDCSVESAVPVRELAVDEDSVNVEMDPEDEVRAAGNIAATPGLRCGQIKRDRIF